MSESLEIPAVQVAHDLWIALRLPGEEFEGYWDRNGWATTWAVLLDAVRGWQYPCQEPTSGDYQACVLPKGHAGPHYGKGDVGVSEPLPERRSA